MSSIRKRPDGRWRARYRDETGREHAKHFDRKVDGQDWLDQVTASIVTSAYVDPNAGKITFSRFYAEWSERQVWVASTQRAMDLAAGSVPFGAVPLKLLRASHFETWVKSMVLRKLAAGTIATRYNNVHAVVRAAVRDKLIAVDQASNITLPRQRKAEAAMTLPTAEQVKALMDAAGDGFSPVVALAAFAGLRAGEIRGLQLGDVNWLGRTLDVQRQAQRHDDIRPPKYGSERTVYLPDALVTILSRHVAAHSLTSPVAWLVPGNHGLPVDESTMRRSWAKARVKAKVSGIRMHDLRHYYASGLISEGCNVVTVQRALGHSNASVTLDTYAHLWPTAEDQTRRAAGSLLSAVLAIPADQSRTESR